MSVDLENEAVDVLEQKFRANQLKMDIRLQEEQFKVLDRALALSAANRSFGSAGDQEVLEGLYAPEDYVDIQDYRRDNFGYQAYAATYTSKTDRQEGRNWPYWVSEPELAAIRGTVRLLSAYNKTCFGILNKLENYTISTGFTRKVTTKRDAPKELLRKIETVLDEFDELNGITGDLDQEVLRRDIRDGEVYLGLWNRGEGRVDIRVVEPDQVSEPTNHRDLEDWLCEHIDEAESGLSFDSNWSFGIHTTKGDACNRHGYYVQWTNDPVDWDYLPGGANPCYPPASGGNTWMESRKSNTDRNIKRGVSDFWPVTGDVELARKMIRNLTHAGAIQSAIAWIREMAPGTTQSQVSSATMSAADWQTNTATYKGGTRTSYQQTYQPGTTLYLGANQKFVPPPWIQQSMASGLVSIFEGMLRSIAQIWSMPEHMITGSASNSNYASILEAGSPFVKEIEKRQFKHENLWKSVYWKVVFFNWKAGRFGRVAWKDLQHAVEIVLTGPQIDVRDRAKDTQRDLELMNAGLLSPTEAASRSGLDYDDEVKKGAKAQGQGQPGQDGAAGGLDEANTEPVQAPPTSGAKPSQPEPPVEGAVQGPVPTAPQPEPQPEQPEEGGDTNSNSDAGLEVPSSQAMNGTQVSAAIELLGQVSAKTIAPEAAAELLVGLGLKADRAERIVKAQADISLKAEPVEPPSGVAADPSIPAGQEPEQQPAQQFVSGEEQPAFESLQQASEILWGNYP